MGRDRTTPPDVAAILLQIAPALARLQNEILGALGTRLTYRQYRLLDWVAHGRDSPTALKDVTTLSLATISASVDGLVGRGLLARAGNPEDRRRVMLELTADGRRAIREGDRAMTDLADELARAYAEPGPGDDVGERLTATLRRVQQRLATD